MDFKVVATGRTGTGSGAAKRLRAGGRVPGIVYGSGAPRMIEVDHDELHSDLSHEAFHSTVLSLELDGALQPVLLRDVQSHPVADRILHVDFQAIAEDAEIWMTVPIHYENQENAPGVRLRHGVFSVIEADVAVHCLPKDLPGHISVDAGHLELNQSIHLSEIAAPPGVRFDALTRGEDPSLVTVIAPKGEVEEQPEAGGEEEDEAAVAEQPAAEQQP